MPTNVLFKIGEKKAQNLNFVPYSVWCSFGFHTRVFQNRLKINTTATLTNSKGQGVLSNIDDYTIRTPGGAS